MTQAKTKNPAETIILQLFKNKTRTKKELFQIQRAVAKKFKNPFLTKDKLVKAYRNLLGTGEINADKNIESLIRLKNTRSLSGIIVVSVLTKPYACPGKCLYCPTQSNVPKSYLANEPAVMRAISCDYDPYRQVTSRLSALNETGHPIDKVNIRIIGGTWSYYPIDYQEWFISELFRACNNFLVMSCDFVTLKPLKLYNLQGINETARCRIVEISIETRQDYVNINEIQQLRKFGVTKVELGVQTIYDDVLHRNNRGNTNADTIKATKMLRDAGFKISYQMMPNLPGSNAKRDEEMFREIFTNMDYKPDYLKIYPLALIKDTPVYQLYKNKEFKPYNKDELANLLAKIKSHIPKYCRIERVIRDIPSSDIIEGGAKNSNLRQVVLDEMKSKDRHCQCIRCREIKSDIEKPAEAIMFRQDYKANNGQEVFLTMESPDRKKLYSLLRLRSPFSGSISHDPHSAFHVLKNAALIREIHTYGRQLAIGTTDGTAAQHQGFGKKLMKEAEKIARQEFGLNKIAVISGVGAREYFRKLGYKLRETYMIKNI